LGLPAIRLRGDYLAIVTIAAAEIFRLLVRDLESVTGGVYGIINFSDSLQIYRPNFVENFAENFELKLKNLGVEIIREISKSTIEENGYKIEPKSENLSKLEAA